MRARLLLFRSLSRSLSLGLVLALLLAGPSALAEEDTAPPAPWLSPEGAVQVGSDGRARRLYQPEFRPAPWLKQQLGLHGLQGLAVDLVTPVVAVAPKPGVAAVPAPQAGRLLLTGTPGLLTQARTLLLRLDKAPRAVLVSILVSEVRRLDRESSGGSVLFDKGAGTNPENTIFRAGATSFEPDDYLRSALTGAMPFEGTSLVFGDLDVSGGAFEYTLRMLQRRGEAEFLAWPSLLVNEGAAGTVTSVELVPQVMLDAAGAALRTRFVTEETGLKLRVTPERIGAESAVLDLDVWLRLPTQVDDGTAPPGTLRLRRRQVTTRLTVRDREPLLFGGLVLRHAARERRGLPRPRALEILDPLHSARFRDVRETEIVFLVRVRIVPPHTRPPELDPRRYRAWTEVGPRARAPGLPGPWSEAKDPTKR